MANTYAIYNTGQIMLEYWLGDIYYSELLDHHIKQKSDDRIKVFTNEIVDFRDAILHISDSDVIQMSDKLSTNMLLKKVALVINPQDWDKASLYSKNAWQLDIEVIAFHTLEAACAWIGFDSVNIDKKIEQLKSGLLVESEY